MARARTTNDRLREALRTRDDRLKGALAIEAGGLCVSADTAFGVAFLAGAVLLYKVLELSDASGELPPEHGLEGPLDLAQGVRQQQRLVSTTSPRGTSKASTENPDATKLTKAVRKPRARTSNGKLGERLHAEPGWVWRDGTMRGGSAFGPNGNAGKLLVVQTEPLAGSFHGIQPLRLALSAGSLVLKHGSLSNASLAFRRATHFTEVARVCKLVDMAARHVQQLGGGRARQLVFGIIRYDGNGRLHSDSRPHVTDWSAGCKTRISQAHSQRLDTVEHRPRYVFVG
jgi:hypothetical protein